MKLPLEYRAPVMVVGGGEVTDAAFYAAYSLTKNIVAADGGADAALMRGAELAAVIGDMDSLSPAARAAILRNKLFEIAEQESTDFDKVVSSIRTPLMLAVGFTGGRTDHELAALHVLLRYPDRAIVMIGSDDIVFHTPQQLQLALPLSTRLSFFPMAPVRTKATGLKWPEGVFDILFDPMRRIGTSNSVAAPKVSVETDAPGLLTIVPMSALAQVIEGLSQAVFHSRGG